MATSSFLPFGVDRLSSPLRIFSVEVGLDLGIPLDGGLAHGSASESMIQMIEIPTHPAFAAALVAAI